MDQLELVEGVSGGNPHGVAMFFGLLGQHTLIHRGGAGGATKNHQFHLSVIKMY